MLNIILEKWKEATTLVAICGAIVWAINFTQSYAGTVKKVQEHDTTLDRVTDILEKLQDPNVWLQNWLVNHGIDTVKAEIWSKYSRGPVTGRDGYPLKGVPFLNDSLAPEMGVLVILTDSSYKILDTLWDFTDKAKL